MQQRRTPEHVRPRPAPESLAQGSISDQAEDRGAGALGIRRGKLHHVLAVEAVVADTADVDGDHRQTGEHRLGDDDAEAFRLGEIEEDVRARRLRHPVGAVAVQGHVIPETALLEQRLERLPFRAVAVDVERRVDVVRPQLGNRLDQKRDVLARHEPSGGSKTDAGPQSILGFEWRLPCRYEEGDHMPFATARKEVPTRLLERLRGIGPHLIDTA